jgi:hypothetical protein
MQQTPKNFPNQMQTNNPQNPKTPKPLFHSLKIINKVDAATLRRQQAATVQEQHQHQQPSVASSQFILNATDSKELPKSNAD